MCEGVEGNTDRYYHYHKHQRDDPCVFAILSDEASVVSHGITIFGMIQRFKPAHGSKCFELWHWLESFETLPSHLQVAKGCKSLQGWGHPNGQHVPQAVLAISPKTQVLEEGQPAELPADDGASAAIATLGRSMLVSGSWSPPMLVFDIVLEKIGQNSCFKPLFETENKTDMRNARTPWQ